MQGTRLDDAGGGPVPVAALHKASGALQAAVCHQSPALGAQVDAAEEEVLLVLVRLLCQGRNFNFKATKSGSFQGLVHTWCMPL